MLLSNSPGDHSGVALDQANIVGKCCQSLSYKVTILTKTDFFFNGNRRLGGLIEE